MNNLFLALAVLLCAFLVPQNAVAKDTVNVQSRIEAIQLPDIEFNQTPFREAIQRLQQLSLAEDPEKKGVMFVIKAEAGNASAATITANLEKPTLAAALAEVATQARYEVKIEKFAVALVPLNEIATDLSDLVLDAARSGEGTRVQEIIGGAFARDVRLDERWASGLLNSLLENREEATFRTLLGQMRQTNLGKDWQPSDEQLELLVRDGRKDFLEILLSSRLVPARLLKVKTFPNEGMKHWITRRVADIEKERSDVQDLIEAAGSGNVEVVRRLVDAGVDVNGRSVDGDSWTPLTRAAAFGKVDVVRTLLDRGAEVDLPKHPGWNYTPLCLTRNPEIADILKSAGADIHAKLFRREVSILTYVAMHNGAPMVQWFLHQGLDPKMIGDNNQTLLFSVKDGSTAELLLKAGVDPNHVDEFGETALQSARGGDVVEALIRGGAKTSGFKTPLLATLIRENSGSAIEKALQMLPPQHPSDLQKALISAAHMDRDKAAEALLKHGAGANVESEWSPGQPTLPLLVCCIFGSEKTARVLLAHGADPNAGEVPSQMLRTALVNQHEDIVKLLRGAGARGASELCVAVATNDSESVRRLIEKAPRFADAPEFWESVLETAAGKNALDVVSKALEAGVPTEVDKTRNVYAAAAAEGHHETLGFLLGKRKRGSVLELKQALWDAVWNSHPYAQQRPAADFERCVQILLDAGAPVHATGKAEEDLIVAAVFTRNPGGNAHVIEMLLAAGADLNPVMAGGTKLSEVIAKARKEGGCYVQSIEVLELFQKRGLLPATQ